MACLSCKERGEMIERAITGLKNGDPYAVKREMAAMGKSFGHDFNSIRQKAQSKLPVSMQQGIGRK